MASSGKFYGSPVCKDIRGHLTNTTRWLFAHHCSSSAARGLGGHSPAGCLGRLWKRLLALATDPATLLNRGPCQLVRREVAVVGFQA